MKNCDMCGTEIKDSKCSCGTWKSKDEMKECPMLKAVEHFNEMKQFTFSGDAPHLGCAVLFFRGDYNDCIELKMFLYKRKGRPFYKEEEE